MNLKFQFLHKIRFLKYSLPIGGEVQRRRSTAAIDLITKVKVVGTQTLCGPPCGHSRPEVPWGFRKPAPLEYQDTRATFSFFGPPFLTQLPF